MTHRLLFRSIVSLLLFSVLVQPALAAPSSRPHQDQAGGVQILSSDVGETVVEFVAPAASIQDGTDGSGPCQRIQMDAHALGGDAGLPHLPVRGTLLGVPAQGDLSLEILSVESETLTVER